MPPWTHAPGSMIQLRQSGSPAALELSLTFESSVSAESPFRELRQEGRVRVEVRVCSTTDGGQSSASARHWDMSNACSACRYLAAAAVSQSDAIRIAQALALEVPGSQSGLNAHSTTARSV
jgi:hypothetical protein